MKRLTFVLTILFGIHYGSCYLCYECTSLDQEWCTAYFVDKDMSVHYDNVVNCTNNCMKLIAHVSESQYFWVRTCDITEGFPGSCSTGSHVLGIPTSTVCVCSGDRCNAVDTIRKRMIQLLFTIFLCHGLHFSLIL